MWQSALQGFTPQQHIAQSSLISAILIYSISSMDGDKSKQDFILEKHTTYAGD